MATSTVPTWEFVWEQGEDGEIHLIHDTAGVPTDLTGYSLRMDVRSPDESEVLYTFNTDDADGMTLDEAVLGTEGQIDITVPRAASLDTGPFVAHLEELLPFDIFLRNTVNKQKKILKGTIKYMHSETLWV